MATFLRAQTIQQQNSTGSAKILRQATPAARLSKRSATPQPHSCYSARVNKVRKFLYWVMEEPDAVAGHGVSEFNKKISRIGAAVILSMILLSLICFILETDPEFASAPDSLWRAIEVITTVTFSVEYLIRLWVCDVFGTSMVHWFLRPMNICDLLAITPMYAELVFKASDIQGLRVLRVIRLFKLGRYSQGVRVMSAALTNSLSALYILIFLFAIGVTIFASGVYYTEKLSCPEFDSGENFRLYNDECNASSEGVSATYGTCCAFQCDGLNTTIYSLCKYSMSQKLVGRGRRLQAASLAAKGWTATPIHEVDFTSVPVTMWWAAATMTTVGYGDYVPKNWVSKLVGSVAMVSGMLIIAMPFAIVGAKFGEAVAIYEDPIAKEATMRRLKTFKRSGTFSSNKTGFARSDTSSVNSPSQPSAQVISPAEPSVQKTSTVQRSSSQSGRVSGPAVEVHLTPARFERLQDQIKESVALKSQILKLQLLRDNLWTSVEHSMAVFAYESIVSMEKQLCFPVDAEGDGTSDANERFCEKSFGVFDRSSWIRRLAICALEWVWFDRIVLMLIVANSIILALHDYYPRSKEPWQNELDAKTEYVFIGLFTAESTLKIIAQGFAMHRNAYLHDAWNWLDFIVVLTGWLTLAIPSNDSDFTFLRTIRVLRPLRTISTMPGMRRLVNTVFLSLPRLKDVMLMALFLLMTYGILGIHFWGGVMHRLCRVTPQPLHFTKDLHFTPGSNGGTCKGWCFDNQTVVQIHLSDGRHADIDSSIVFQAFCKSTQSEQISSCESAFNSGRDYYMWPVDSSQSRFCGARSCPTTNPNDFGFGVNAHVLINSVLIPMGVAQQQNASETYCGNAFSSDSTYGPRAVNTELDDINLNDWSEEVFQEDFNWGITRYDHLAAAFLVIFQCVTLEGWVDIMYMVQDAFSPSFFGFIYFVSLVIIGSFFLLNITLAIVWEAFSAIRERGETSLNIVPLRSNATTQLEGGVADGARHSAASDPTRLCSLASSVAASSERSSTETDVAKDDSRRELLERAGGFDASIRDLHRASSSKPGVAPMMKGGFFTGSKSIRSRLTRRFTSGSLRKKGTGETLADLVNEEHQWRIVTEARKIARNPVFGVLVMSAIAANVVVLSMDKYPDPFLNVSIVESTNLVFNIIFFVEFIILHIAFGPWNYWSDKALAFDGIIVLLSVVDIALVQRSSKKGGGSGFTSIRAFRLLRIFKLAKRFPQMRGLLAAVAQTLLEMRDFVFLLFLIIVVFTLVGQSFFGGKFMFDENTGKVVSRDEQPILCPFGESGKPKCVPRAHFDTFLSGFVTVFQILTGENWNTVMYDGMKAAGWPYSIYFISVVVFGNFVILNLFLAILMMNFEIAHEKMMELEKERTRLRRQARKKNSAVHRKGGAWADLEKFQGVVLKKMQTSSSKNLLNKLEDTKSPVGVESPPTSPAVEHEDETGASSWALKEPLPPHCVSENETPTQDASDLKLENVSDTSDKVGRMSEFSGGEKKERSVVRFMTDPRAESPSTPTDDGNPEYEHLAQMPAGARVFMNSVGFNRGSQTSIQRHSETSIDTDETDATEAKLKKERSDLTVMTTTTVSPLLSRGLTIMQNHSPEILLSLWMNSLFLFSSSSSTRRFCCWVIGKKFDNVILVCIVASSALMMFQNPLHDPDGTKEVFLNWANVVFTAIFAAEMLIKIIARGLLFSQRGNAYLGSPWNIVDSMIVVVSVADTTSFLFSSGTDSDVLSIIQIFRLARVLRPLRLISQNKNLRIVVKTIYASIPDLRNLVLFSFIVFLIFGLLGVSFYKGSFYRCKSKALEEFAFQHLGRTPLCIPTVPLPGSATAGSMRFAVHNSVGTCPSTFDSWQRPTEDTPVCEVHCENNNHPFCKSTSPWGYNIMRCSDCKESFCAASSRSYSDCKSECSSHSFFCRESHLNGHAMCLEQCINACMCESFCRPLSEDAALCVEQGGRWVNMNQHFNNILESWVSLLEISTTEGWVDMMYAAVDSQGPMKEPRRDKSPVLGVSIFVSFILVGSFFVLNLCVGVVINNYHIQITAKEEKERVYMTKAQRKWVSWQKELYLTKTFFAQTNLHLLSPTRHHLVEIVTSTIFDNFIMVCICLNTIILGMQVHPTPKDPYAKVLEKSNLVFAIIFNVEAAMKLGAMNCDYFQDSWNCFDFLCVAISDIFLVIENTADMSVELGTTVNTIRIFRIARLFRLVRFLKGLSQLVRAFILSVPKLINVGLIMGLLIYLYAILGLNLFAKVGYLGTGTYNDQANFRTFPQAVSVLIRSLTGEAWNEIMHDLSKGRFFFESVVDVACVETLSITSSNFKSLDLNGDGVVDHPNQCGGWGAYVYFISYTICCTFIVLNLFIAVILDAFDESQRSEFVDIFSKCLDVWKDYDPQCTMYLPLEKALDFIDDVVEALQKQGSEFTKVGDCKMARYDNMYTGEIKEGIHSFAYYNLRYIRMLGLKVGEPPDFQVRFVVAVKALLRRIVCQFVEESGKLNFAVTMKDSADQRNVNLLDLEALDLVLHGNDEDLLRAELVRLRALEKKQQRLMLEEFKTSSLPESCGAEIAKLAALGGSPSGSEWPLGKRHTAHSGHSSHSGPRLRLHELTLTDEVAAQKIQRRIKELLQKRRARNATAGQTLESTYGPITRAAG